MVSKKAKAREQLDGFNFAKMLKGGVINMAAAAASFAAVYAFLRGVRALV